MSRPVGGVLSGPLARLPVAIHLCGPPGDCTRRCGRATIPCLALLRVGFAEPPGSPRALVRSYRTVSPLPVPTGRPAGPSAVCSLWHFPAGRPDWPLASTLPCGVPTFLDTDTPRRDHPADSPSPPVCQPHSRVATANQRPPRSSARWRPCRQRRRYTYEAEPTARVTLPNGDGNSCSSGMSDVRMIEWRRSTAPTDCTVWRSSRVVNIDANT